MSIKPEGLRRWDGIIIILLLYISWCCKTVAYGNRLFLLAGFICGMASLAIYATDVRRFECCKHITDKLSAGLAVMCIIIAQGSIRKAYSIPGSDKVVKAEILGSMADPVNLMMGLEALIWAMTLIVIMWKLKVFERLKDSIKSIRIGRQDIPLLVLLMLVVVLSIDPDWYQFKWDGRLYYVTSMQLNLTSVSNLAVYGHIAQAFGAIVAITQYVIPNTAYALLISNIALLLFGTVYFYRIVKDIAGIRSSLQAVLCTAVFAFSPYYLGMVDYYSLDFHLLCVFPAVIYYGLKKDWIPFILAGLVFSFTKEPAIIIYGGFCAGLLLCDLISGRVSVKRVFVIVRYYYMALPGVLWLVTYKALGPWSAGGSSVGYESEYAASKMAVLYVLNFNWIFVCMIVASVIVMTILHKWSREHLEHLFPVVLSLIAFTGFSVIFNTANHARYIDSVPCTLYFMAVYLLCRLMADMTDNDGVRPNLRRGRSVLIVTTAGLLAGLMLISSYILIDPVSRVVFKNMDAGDMTVLTTSGAYGDGSIYNRQMLGMERVISDAVSDALIAGDKIVIPAIGGSVYASDGLSESISLPKDSGYIWDEQYFDIRKRVRVPVRSPYTEDFNILRIKEGYSLRDIEGLSPGDRVSVIYTSGMDPDKVAAITDQIDTEQTREYAHRGWVAYSLTGTVKDE